MSEPRVVVTGMGVICAVGHKVAQFWDALSQGRPGIGAIRSVDTSRLRFQKGAEVSDYEPGHYFAPDQLAVLDRFAQFALIAAREALLGSGVSLTSRLGENTAVVCGSCLGGQSTQDSGFADLYQQGRGRVHPLSIPRIMANAGASHISIEFGITGPVYAVSTACSSATHAIGQAFRMVRAREVELAIAGGSEARFSMGVLKAWEAMRVIAPDTCRPFSCGRRGMVLGEGGAMLVLEPLDAARARGATI